MDALIRRGLTCVTVVDISPAALERARRRLGDAARLVRWVRADVTSSCDVGQVDIWHDRAVFHFLNDAGARQAYIELLYRTMKPSAAAIIATFATDGPVTCSGLPVCRYSASTLSREIGSGFVLEHVEREEHHTPRGAIQPFQWTLFRRAGVA